MKYEKWSLGYWFLKNYVRTAAWFVQGKTIISGINNIPANKPVVFAPNHQNALNDALAVLLYTKHQPVWLARADIFGKSKIIDAALRFFKIIPVYRIRDGIENLDKNQETFSTSVKVLENNSALALFPEAAHTFRKQLLPHKKAVPRIVFMAEERSDRNLDIQIIPTGIYYSHYWKFNRTLMVNFGKPVAVNEFLEAYSQNPNATTVALKKRIYNATLPLVINIKSKKYYEEFERLMELYGTHFTRRRTSTCTMHEKFRTDQELANQLDKLEKKKPQMAEQLIQKGEGLYNMIKKLKLRPWLVTSNSTHFLKFCVDLLIFLSGLPVFLYGFILNAPPYYITDKLVRKKIKDHSFWGTFFLVLGFILFPLYYLILTVLLLILDLPVLPVILFIISLPFAGKLAFIWYLHMRKLTGRSRLLLIKWFRPNTFRILHEKKSQLFNQLDDLIDSEKPGI